MLNQVIGDAGNDTLFATEADDEVRGNGVNDVIRIFRKCDHTRSSDSRTAYLIETLAGCGLSTCCRASLLIDSVKVASQMRPLPTLFYRHNLCDYQSDG